MVEQKIEKYNNIPDGSLLGKYLEGQREMDRLQDGAQLRAAARSVLKQLPDGPVTLVATSGAGAGLAAACAAIRHQPTRWNAINLWAPTQHVSDPVVVVDPVDAGDGWRGAVLRRIPKAVFVQPTTTGGGLSLAA